MSEVAGPTTDAGQAQETALLRSIMDRVEEKALQPPPPPRRPRNPAAPLFVTVPLLLLTTAVNLSWERVPELSPTDEARAVRFELHMIALEIEHFRSENGRLPNSLVEVGLEDDELAYQIANDGFLLYSTVEGEVVHYRPDDGGYQAELTGLLNPVGAS